MLFDDKTKIKQGKKPDDEFSLPTPKISQNSRKSTTAVNNFDKVFIQFGLKGHFIIHADLLMGLTGVKQNHH